MTNFPTCGRRDLITCALAILAMPAVPAVAAEPGIASRFRMRTIGGQILANLAPLPVEGAFFGDHFRVRMPASILITNPGEDHLSPDGVAIATRVAEILHRWKGWTATLVGHAALADRDYRNFVISKRLAVSFRATLISRGIEAGRMVASGAGASEPLAPRFADDRLELVIRSS